MSFHTEIENILKTGPRNLEFYLESTRLFWIITVKNINNLLSLLNKKEHLGSIKSKVIRVIPEGENSISLVNFRRIPAYIEFYNPDKKQCVRIILSTLGVPYVVVCFYSNYDKNGKNNHLSRQTIMVNEFIGPAHLTQDDNFVEKMVLFLLGSNDTPYASIMGANNG